MRLNYIWWFGNYGRLQSTWKLSFLFCLSNSWIFQFKIEHVIREWFVKLGFATSSIILKKKQHDSVLYYEFTYVAGEYIQRIYNTLIFDFIQTCIINIILNKNNKFFLKFRK
jgi:hypothetical protein